jgi:dihydrofolate reductase
MKVALIVAIDNERGIGKNNDLMWHLPADMQFFKATTSGHIVVTGRKNYDFDKKFALRSARSEAFFFFRGLFGSLQ